MPSLINNSRDRIITLFTDFGLRDTYVGVIKGVILSINPNATIVDITHEVAPQDIEEGVFLIEEYWRLFPPRTIHLCVIDPTVGSARRPLIVSKDNYFFVGPDNGLLTRVLEGAEVHLVDNREFMMRHISNTFHGRDIFAPAAAHLSLGTELSTFGPLITDPVKINDVTPSAEENRLTGKVIRFDHFGNAVTNIRSDLLRGFVSGGLFHIQVGRMNFHRICKSFYEDELTCIEGSSGYIEFGKFNGSFQNISGVKRNGPVVVTRE